MMGLSQTTPSSGRSRHCEVKIRAYTITETASNDWKNTVTEEYGITSLSVAVRIEELSALEKGAELL
jgi:hypothetical protein